MERSLAAARARQAAAHPKWSELSVAARVDRLAMLAGRAVGALRKRVLQAGAVTPPVADFQGNRTLISADSGQGFVLQRQADCSLRYLHGSYTVSFTNPAINVLGTTPGFQNTLHAQAGLSTAANAFPAGCASPALGIGSRRGFFLGRTSQGWDMFASAGYDNSVGTNALYLGTIDPATQTVHSFARDYAQPGIYAIVAGDLNGDGLADVVGLDVQSSTIAVWLAQADGSVGAARKIALPGRQTRAAVMGDFDGDGKVDLVVATIDAAGQEIVSVLLGRGDGTFAAPQSINVSTPRSAMGPTTITNLVAADLRGLGRLDVVASNGVVLLNDGKGRLTQGANAFVGGSATSAYGPNLVAADFNHDGKPDLAVNDGTTIQIFIGRGDGSFAPGPAYASNDSVGYMTATDLDGDGNVDLYVGLANGGYFGGDQFEVGQGYALMGNGDGSFRGAPALPFVYTGRNLVDLNGDGVLDAVGVNADVSFTSWIGDGHGGFTRGSTLAVSQIKLGSETFALQAIDSFALVDVNGDGKPDLVFIGKDFFARNSTSDSYTPGLLIALGDGRGGFAAPVFVPAPTFSPPGDIDYDLQLSNLIAADVNGDGKADLIYSYRVTAYRADTVTVGTAVQTGRGDGTFNAPRTMVFHRGPRAENFLLTSKVQQVADLNRDGKPDLVFVTQTPAASNVLGQVSKIQVALGAGDGSFAAPVDVSGPEQIARTAGDTTPAALVVADMDGDGVPDLVALGGTQGGQLQLAVMLGKGDGTFKAPLRVGLAGQYLAGEQQIAVADFNGDGKPDVALFDPYSGRSGLLFGRGDGSLLSGGEPDRRIVLPLGGAARALDLSGAGKTDVLVGRVLLLSVAAASAPAADFALAASSAGATVAAGQSAVTTLTLTPSGGFSGAVSFACSGLPAGTSCTFAPAGVNLGAAAGTTTLTIATSARTSAAASSSAVALAAAGLPAALLALAAAAPWGLRRQRGAGAWSRQAAVALAALALAALLLGCGGGGGGDAGGGVSPPPSGGTPAGNYAVQVSASGGGVAHAVTFNLAVN
ncbi:MAG: VCBS repeat-containing protein [Rubrivivax sp.]